MTDRDESLGMKRNITRRDILAGGAAAAAFSPVLTGASELVTRDAKSQLNGEYPPAKTGLRGNHKGAYEVAHQLGREGRTDWGEPDASKTEQYDLVIVGAGLSGLAAAFFYREKNPDAKILILDNHDDFGGHAKRNEFTVNGQTLIGYGGSQTLQEPSSYPKVVKKLLNKIGVDLTIFEKAYDTDFYQRNNLRGGIFFNADQWGKNTIVSYDIGYFEDYLPVAKSTLTPAQAVAQMPMSEEAKAQLLRTFTLDVDQLKSLGINEKISYLYGISYRDFLADHLSVNDEAVFNFFQDLTSDLGAGIDAVSAATALAYSGLPGWGATGLPQQESSEPYIHHFPDGNASIARLIVRALIPQVSFGSDMLEVLTAPFDYSKLDATENDTRLRLSSTVVQVSQNGSANGDVSVKYVKNGETHVAIATGCILACQHSMIPHLCPELPDTQREALSFHERSPILYTSVAVQNWRAWKTLGVGAVIAPGSYYVHAKLDFPVSMGAYEYSSDPDQPVIIHMERFPHVNNEGLSVREQHRIGRHSLVTTSFETIERETRAQLSAMLGDAGFNAANDIAGITVNRWAHGYAYSYSDLFDETYEDYNDPRSPHMIARQSFGRIAIANSDSAANAMFEAAVEQAHRAVLELT